MKLTKVTLTIVIVLAYASFAQAAVLLDEDFSGGLGNWTVLNSTSSGSASITTNSANQLSIELTNAAQGRLQGVMSNATFVVAPGQTLIMDYYGTNNDSASAPGLNAAHSSPVWLTSAYNAATDGFFPTWKNYAQVKGKDSYVNDYARWYGWGASSLSYLGTGTQTWAAFKHVIMTIDAAEINFYIEDDYYENLINPTSLKTLPTSTCFTAGDLAGGLHAYVLNTKSTSWFTGTTTNLYDGVRVSVTPEPATLLLLGLGTITGIIRRKQS